MVTTEKGTMTDSPRHLGSFSRLVLCLLGVRQYLLYNRNSILLWGTFLFIFFLYSGKGIIHITKEFAFQRNYNPAIFKSYKSGSSNNKVPKIIHQIFFNMSSKSTEFLKQYQPYVQTWKNMNPDFEYILWNTSMINKLLTEKYPEIKTIYDKYETRWNLRTDIARYLIAYEVGGVYADMDLKCKRSMNVLYQAMGNKGIALNFTYNPIGMATDFFVTSKNHKFWEHTIDGLREADSVNIVPYFNALLRTGPLFLLGRYLSYPHKEEVYAVPTSLAHDLIDRSHFGRSWHEIDGLIISFVWDHFGRLVFLLPVVIILFLICRKRRRERSRSCEHIA